LELPKDLIIFKPGPCNPISRLETAGIITVITGLLGVIIGAVMGAKLRPKFPTADPLICGFGVLAAVPLIYLMMLLARGPTGPTYATFFFGQWLVNLNWSLATEMIMVNLIDNSRLKLI
jgi:hypothetical protein